MGRTTTIITVVSTKTRREGERSQDAGTEGSAFKYHSHS